MSVHRVVALYRCSPYQGFHHEVYAALRKLGVPVKEAWVVVLPEDRSDEIKDFVAEDMSGRVVQVSQSDWFCSRLEDAILLDMRFR